MKRALTAFNNTIYIGNIIKGTAKSADYLGNVGLGMMGAVGADLRDFGLGDDARIFTADTFGGIWMFGGFEPLQGGAPWYYGGLSGFENADYLLVPTCPITPRAFKAILKDIEEREAVELSLLRETELYRLYALDQ